MNQHKYLILIIFCILVSFNCATYRKCKECRAYYQLIKENWVLKPDSTFTFTGYDYLKYAERQKCLQYKCLNGLSKKEIIHLFGEPTKSVKKFSFNNFEYCTDKKCVKNIYTGSYGHSINFYFDKNDRVADLYTAPLGTDDQPK